MVEKLKSRKLVTLMLTTLFVIANDVFEMGVSEDTITKLVGALVAYLVAQGIADHGNQGKKPGPVVDDGPNWEDTTEVDEEDKKELLG